MTESVARWTAAAAWEWYHARPWLCGFNYVPSTAVNTTEFWQAATFDPATIARELGWAATIGFNTCRAFLQYLVWERDRKGLLARLDEFLALADARGISTMLVLFDDRAFAGKQPSLGAQDAPVPGVHNSGWTPSPGHLRATDERFWPDLERYVQSVIGQFGQDPRVLCWDLYNEPGNGGVGEKSLPLLEAAFDWARAAEPMQPLTAGIWSRELRALNARSVDLADVISFHNYDDVRAVRAQVTVLEIYGRPLLCTEWMQRTAYSTFATHLPFFKERAVGCYSWGLVNGRTQTHLPWRSSAGATEPDIWFHDLLRPDGTAYDDDEIFTLHRILTAGR